MSAVRWGSESFRRISTKGGGFSVDGGDIRYGLAAIKSIGRPVIRAIVNDRKELGEFRNLEDFITRISSRELMNKRLVEISSKPGHWMSWGDKKAVHEYLYSDRRPYAAGKEKFHGRSDEPVRYGERGAEGRVSDQNAGCQENIQRRTSLDLKKRYSECMSAAIRWSLMKKSGRKVFLRPLLIFQVDPEVGYTKVRDGAREIIGGTLRKRR